MRERAAVPVPSAAALLLHALRTRQSLAQLRASLARARACRRCMRLNDGRLLLHGACGVFARCDATAEPTLNGRLYSKAELVREARAFAERHASGDALGAFGHPSAAAGGGYHATPAAGASHAVAALTWRGDALEGVLEARPSPAGAALVRALVAGVVNLGVSTRGWGHMQPAGPGATAVRVADFQLVAFDVVEQPATRGAALEPLAARDDALCARTAGVLLRAGDGA